MSRKRHRSHGFVFPTFCKKRTRVTRIPFGSLNCKGIIVFICQLIVSNYFYFFLRHFVLLMWNVCNRPNRKRRSNMLISHEQNWEKYLHFTEELWKNLSNLRYVYWTLCQSKYLVAYVWWKNVEVVELLFSFFLSKTFSENPLQTFWLILILSYRSTMRCCWGWITSDCNFH